MKVNRRLKLFVFICLTFCVTNFVSAQSDFYGKSTSGSEGFEGYVWYHERTYKFEKGVLRVPSEKQLENLAVQWNEPKIDVLERFCTISGKLLTRNDKGLLEPISWQQTIGVHLGRQPGAKPDWSQGTQFETSLGSAEVVNQDGTFQASFDLRSCKPRLENIRELQVGLALAEQTIVEPGVLSVSFRSSSPVLKQSLKMIKIPEPVELPPIIRLIQRASDWPENDPSPIQLIRASNSLRKLTKREVLQALTEYWRLCMSEFPDTFETFIIFGLVQCVFEPADPSLRLPAPGYLANIPSPTGGRGILDWPRSPMEIHEDIPLLIGHSYGISGPPFGTSLALDWVNKYGVICETPLRPADNPLIAMNRLMKEPRFQRLEEDSRATFRSQLQEQAYAMVADLLPPIPIDADSDEPDLDQHWNKLLEDAQSLGLHWDEDKQMYAIKPSR